MFHSSTVTRVSRSEIAVSEEGATDVSTVDATGRVEAAAVSGVVVEIDAVSEGFVAAEEDAVGEAFAATEEVAVEVAVAVEVVAVVTAGERLPKLAKVGFWIRSQIPPGRKGSKSSASRTA